MAEGDRHAEGAEDVQCPLRRPANIGQVTGPLAVAVNERPLSALRCRCTEY